MLRTMGPDKCVWKCPWGPTLVLPLQGQLKKGRVPWSRVPRARKLVWAGFTLPATLPIKEVGAEGNLFLRPGQHPPEVSALQV